MGGGRRQAARFHDRRDLRLSPLEDLFPCVDQLAADIGGFAQLVASLSTIGFRFRKCFLNRLCRFYLRRASIAAARFLPFLRLKVIEVSRSRRDDCSLRSLQVPAVQVER